MEEVAGSTCEYGALLAAGPDRNVVASPWKQQVEPYYASRFDSGNVMIPRFTLPATQQ
jgi:hypothetical protein